MLEAVALGLVIVPTGGPDGKRPLVEEWQRRRLPTVAELEEWQRKWPAHNYGILTGSASGLDCFDVDVDGSGWTLLAVWARLDEAVGPIPETWAHETGNGVHVFVRHVLGACSGSRILGLPVDYLSDGRQVVGAGSVHPSGKLYAELEPVRPVAGMTDPARLLEALHAPGREPAPIGSPEASKRRLRPRRGVSGEQALTRVVASIERAQVGTRNDTLNRVVYGLGPYIVAGDVNRAELEQVCRAAAERAGLQRREVAATLRSAINDGIRDSAAAERLCEEPPCPGPPRSITRARRRPRQALPTVPRQELVPALAAIFRTARTALWDWRGAQLDRALYDLLLGLAQKGGESLQVEPRIRWLSEQLGMHTHYVRASLRRLEAAGWIVLVRQGGPTGEHSVRAPSAWALRIPAHMAVVPPMSNRAHQLELLPIGGSTGFSSEAMKSLGVLFCRGSVPDRPEVSTLAAARPRQRRRRALPELRHDSAPDSSPPWRVAFDRAHAAYVRSRAADGT